MEIIRCDTIQFTLRCLSIVTIKKSLSFNIGSSKKNKKTQSHWPKDPSLTIWQSPVVETKMCIYWLVSEWLLMVGGSCCKSIAKTSVTQTYCVTHYNHCPLGENVNSFSGWKKPLYALVASRFRCSPTAYLEHADFFTPPGSSGTVKSMAQTGNRKLLQNNVCYNTEGQLLIWRWTFSTSSLCRFFWQIVSNCLQTSGKLLVTKDGFYIYNS